MKNNAILLMHCPDQKGIVAAVTDFLLKNNGNIIDLDEHVDVENRHFYMRVEWELDDFLIPDDKIQEYFDVLIGSKFEIRSELCFCTHRPRMAIFVSKYSHCLYDILARKMSKEWDVDIPLVVSNHENLKKVADQYNLSFHQFPITKTNKKEQELKQIDLLKKHNIDIIVFARYMQIVTNQFVEAFPNQIINIHHSSLPAFQGANPYKAAFERGVKFMGATAHYVTEDLDAGPIISQGITQISHRDSVADLKRKGRDIEKVVLAQAIWSHINHKVIVKSNKTVVFE